MYRGMVVREGTIDDNIVRQVWDDYGLLDFEGKVVLDGGAHIGAFTDMVARNKARKVLAFEPEIENARLFRMNHGIDDEFLCFYTSALVSPGPVSHSNIFTYYGENRGMHSLIEGAMEARGIGNYGKQVAHLVSLNDVLKIYSPDIIKLDIEGSETEMFPVLLSDKNSASQMAIEFHALNDEMREANIEFVNNLLKRKTGWEAVKLPSVDEGHQSTVGVFKR